MLRACLLVLCLLLPILPARAVAPDGGPMRYTVTIAEDARHAEVEADLWLGGDLLALYNVVDVPGLANGQASLVEGLEVVDAMGHSLAVEDLGAGDFRLPGGGRVHVRYRVRLEHDRHPWPMGSEEVGYRTPEGVMLAGYSLFLADAAGAMAAPIEVGFSLPPGWIAHVPWQAAGEGRFLVPSRRELLSNVLFLGTAAAETFDAGGVSLTLVLGERYRAQRDRFVHLLRTQLRSYADLFGGPPRSDRYLVIINEHPSGDGGAFASSFSQYIAGDADAAGEVVWGYVMAHELLHFWNGLTLAPADHREEWFKEGATDYLTIVTLSRNGLIDEALLLRRLENVPRRYLIARLAQGLRMSVRDAGADKQPNRQLVYGGGSLAALALDVELRKRSGDCVGLPQLLRAMHAEFAEPGASYDLDDIARIAGTLAGGDFKPFLEGIVGSEAYFDIRPAYADLGLRMDSFVEEMYLGRDPKAGAAERARFEAIFAPPVGDGFRQVPAAPRCDMVAAG